MIRLGAGLTSIALAAGIAACGGSSNGSGSPDSSVTAFAHAVVSGDAKQACDDMTSHEANAVGQALAGSCTKAMTAIAREVRGGGSAGNFLKHPDIKSTKVMGDSATVMMKGVAGRVSPVKLTKVNGQWLISAGVS